MAVNDLTFNQLSAVLAEITSQATGQKVAAPVNYAQFVSVGTTALKTGYDPLLTAISQVLNRTIFSVRPYRSKFGGLLMSNQQFGNHVRKLSVVDKPFEDDQQFSLEEGQSIDHYKVDKPKVLQLNFYGANVYQKHITIYQHQLDCAFSGPSELGSFITMIMQNAADMLEQARENTARGTVSNLILATAKHGDSSQICHLFTEWKTLRGLTAEGAPATWKALTAAQFDDFIKWSYARINTIAKMMTERTKMFHLNVTDNVVMRHTPFNRMKAYFATSINEQIKTSVLSSVFNDEYMRVVDGEEVNFWQNIKEPLKIEGNCEYLKADGSLATESNAKLDNVFGVIFDEEAAGITNVMEQTATTPMNAAGLYSNMYFHRTVRYFNDQSENCVVFLLD